MDSLAFPDYHDTVWIGILLILKNVMYFQVMFKTTITWTWTCNRMLYKL